MEVLSPRSANIPSKSRTTMQKPSKDANKQQTQEKPSNPDRIDDRWRPPVVVTEPGETGLTYTVGKKLGKGGFAVCFEGLTQTTSELFALKVVKAKVEQKKMMEKFRTEMQIHAKMRHPNIVEFYRAFSLQDHTYVVLELCGNGSLTDMVKKRECLSLPEVRRFMVQICGGVKYMHKRNVIHRDLKMGNIFLDAEMNVKIGDFGLAAVLADDNDRRTTLCGTPNYIAPEILSKSGTRGHDSKVDVWAIGVICYAMLIGVPPFQSKTQQEIYSRLKTLDYEWKVDSKNHIPQEAKDFVAACLNLVATDRPEMDDLVEFDFFKTGVIADVLDRDCLLAKPVWLLNADPRGDRVMPGHGVQHTKICTESGVGRFPDGKYRPAAGEKGTISTLTEIEAENRQGCAPVTPLPEGILYRQFTDPEPQRPAFQRSIAARPRSKKPMEDAREILTGVSTNPMTTERQVSSARPIQSFAATQRQQAMPTRRTIPTRSLVVDSQLPLLPTSNATQSETSNGLLRARPVRTATRSTRATEDDVQPPRLALDSNKPNNLHNPPQTETESAKEASSVPTLTGTLRSRGIPRPRSVAYDVTQPRPQSSASNSSSENDRRKPLKSVTGNSQPKAQTIVSLAEKDGENVRKLQTEELKPAFLQSSTFKPRMIDEREPCIRVHGTSYTHVMRSLREMHSVLSNPIPTRSSRSSRSSVISKPYPRVEKWVDYATKHGIAYLLTDGTLGMLLKSKQDTSSMKPSSSIVLRHAKRHTELRARNKTQQYIPQGLDVSPVEFYEQADPSEPMRRIDVPASKFALDLPSHENNQSAAASTLLKSCRGAESHRLKEVGLLDKFGKYMHKQMGTSSADDSTTTSLSSSSAQYKAARAQENTYGHLITFYQRLGNVGAWRFADGGIQFNFPDHTKLIIYTVHENLDEPLVYLDAVHLEAGDARDMSKYGSVTHEALERRAVTSWPLSSIASPSGNLSNKDNEIVTTNEIREKLDWIRGVLGCWIKHGGLGFTGDEKLGWRGLGVRNGVGEGKKKMGWVTVGRPGGDGCVASDV